MLVFCSLDGFTWHNKAEHLSSSRLARVYPRMLRATLKQNITLLDQPTFSTIKMTLYYDKVSSHNLNRVYELPWPFSITHTSTVSVR